MPDEHMQKFAVCACSNVSFLADFSRTIIQM